MNQTPAGARVGLRGTSPPLRARWVCAGGRVGGCAGGLERLARVSPAGRYRWELTVTSEPLGKPVQASNRLRQGSCDRRASGSRGSWRFPPGRGRRSLLGSNRQARDGRGNQVGSLAPSDGAKGVQRDQAAALKPAQAAGEAGGLGCCARLGWVEQFRDHGVAVVARKLVKNGLFLLREGAGFLHAFIMPIAVPAHKRTWAGSPLS